VEQAIRLLTQAAQAAFFLINQPFAAHRKLYHRSNPGGLV
jgi:hypothetical protein